MRLLAVADLHYSLPQFDWVLEIAADFDVVVLAGDHLELASIVDRRAQSVVVRKYFSRLRALTRLVTCSGNHDLDAPNETGEKIAKWLGGGQTEGVSSDGESFMVDDTLFTICPPRQWPPIPSPASRRNSPRPRGSAQAVDLDPSRAADKSPISWGGARYFGDTELRTVDRRVPARHRVLRPRASVAFREGRLWVDRIGNTWVFNAGQHSAPRRRTSSSIPMPARRCGFPRRAISSFA
jgi:predicted phosphodiesterase